MFRGVSGLLQGASLIFNFCWSDILSSRLQAIKFKDSENSKDSPNLTELLALTASTATYYTKGNFPLAVSSESRIRIWIRTVTD